MKDLRLSLKKKWFEMTKSGEKREDYREITPYWVSRLFLSANCKLLNKELADSILTLEKEDIYWLNSFFKNNGVFKNFTTNTMTLGYPSNNDKDRIIQFEHEGIEIRTGNTDWGAEEGKLYFVIKHGKKLCNEI